MRSRILFLVAVFHCLPAQAQRKGTSNRDGTSHLQKSNKSLHDVPRKIVHTFYNLGKSLLPKRPGELRVIWGKMPKVFLKGSSVPLQNWGPEESRELFNRLFVGEAKIATHGTAGPFGEQIFPIIHKSGLKTGMTSYAWLYKGTDGNQKVRFLEMDSQTDNLR